MKLGTCSPFSLRLTSPNPEVVLSIRAVEDGAVFHWVALGLDGGSEPEILQGECRGSRQGLADVVARMIIPFDNYRRDAVPEEIHRGSGASRPAPEINNGMFLVRHDTKPSEFPEPVVMIMQFFCQFRQQTSSASRTFSRRKGNAGRSNRSSYCPRVQSALISCA